jgi:hypothetical protein
MRKFSFALTLLIFVHVSITSAQPVFEVVGQDGDNLGVGLSCDGNELLVGIPGKMNSTLNGVGEMHIYQPSSQTQLATVTFPFTALGAERFGQRVLTLGDLNADTQRDYVISAPSNFSGQVLVYTNIGSSPTFVLNGAQTFEEFGRAIADIGDVTGDGISDLLVSAPGRSNSQFADGVVLIYNLVDGSGPTVWASYTGESAGEKLGEEIVVLDDYDSDSRLDFAASAPSAITANGNSGLVRVYSGSNAPTTLAVFNGAEGGERFGHSIAAVGDLNNDGFDELLVGAPQSSINGAGSGRVVLYSGAGIAAGSTNPQTLCVLSGAVAGDNFGYAVQGLGDIDGDGRREFAIGAPGSFQASGSVTFYEFVGGNCIQQGTLLQSSGGIPNSGDRFGSVIAGAGGGATARCDFNGDGVADYGISSMGMATSNGNGRTGAYLGQIVAAPPPPPTPVPPAEASSANFKFKIDEKGKFTAQVVYNRPPSANCTATLLARFYSQGALSKPVALDTISDLKTINEYKVVSLPKALKLGEKKPVVHMIVRTSCAAQPFDSNVFARFMNCGNNTPAVPPAEWLSILYNALKSGSAVAVSVSGDKKLIKGKVKPRSFKKKKK